MGLNLTEFHVSNFYSQISTVPHLIVQQRKEMAELFGFETRNKYEILTANGEKVAFAAEQQKGPLGLILRQILGHWRAFDLHIYDLHRQEVGRAIHPFRWFFQRLEVINADGKKLGALQQRFALFHKKFDLEASDGRVKMSVCSPFWRIWTFPVMAQGREVARVEKNGQGFSKKRS